MPSLSELDAEKEGQKQTKFLLYYIRLKQL